MIIPDERHEREQYFFRIPTAAALCIALAEFDRPCVLCAPLVGEQLARRRSDVRVLDIDDRFAWVRGFRHWNLRRPTHLSETFGVIFCDPPFFTASLSELFAAIRMLANYDLQKPLAITYLSRRARAITSVFAPFNLAPTGYHPEYISVPNVGRNAIEVFANFDCPLWTRSAHSPRADWPSLSTSPLRSPALQAGSSSSSSSSLL